MYTIKILLSLTNGGSMILVYVKLKTKNLKLKIAGQRLAQKKKKQGKKKKKRKGAKEENRL